MTSSDTSVVEVLPAEQDAKVQHDSIFPLRLKESPALWHLGNTDIHLEVTSLLTGQQVQIPVKLKLIAGKPGEGIKEKCLWIHVQNDMMIYLYYLYMVCDCISLLILQVCANLSVRAWVGTGCWKSLLSGICPGLQLFSSLL